MALDRESLMVALQLRIRAACPVLTTVDRNLRLWGDVSASEQPAAFLVAGPQSPSYATANAPPVWTMQATLYLYARNDADPRDPPGSVLNDLITAVEGALERVPADGAGGSYPAVGFNTTLGGRCQRARIVGSIETDEGALGDQLVAVITIEMLASG